MSACTQSLFHTACNTAVALPSHLCIASCCSTTAFTCRIGGAACLQQHARHPNCNSHCCIHVSDVNFTGCCTSLTWYSGLCVLRPSLTLSHEMCRCVRGGVSTSAKGYIGTAANGSIECTNLVHSLLTFQCVQSSQWQAVPRVQSTRNSARAGGKKTGAIAVAARCQSLRSACTQAFVASCAASVRLFHGTYRMPAVHLTVQQGWSAGIGAHMGDGQ